MSINVCCFLMKFLNQCVQVNSTYSNMSSKIVLDYGMPVCQCSYANMHANSIELLNTWNSLKYQPFKSRGIQQWNGWQCIDTSNHMQISPVDEVKRRFLLIMRWFRYISVARWHSILSTILSVYGFLLSVQWSSRHFNRKIKRIFARVCVWRHRCHWTSFNRNIDLNRWSHKSSNFMNWINFKAGVFRVHAHTFYWHDMVIKTSVVQCACAQN